MVNFNKNKYNVQYFASINQFYDLGYHKFNLNKEYNVLDKKWLFPIKKHYQNLQKVNN